MDTLITFIKVEKLKMLATTIVAGFFLYFWIQGPFQQLESILHLEHEPTEFAIPKLVGDERKVNTFSTVGEAETHGFGNGILLDKKKNDSSFGLIMEENAEDNFSEGFTQKIIQHANQLYSETGEFELKSSKNLYYATRGKSNDITYLESTSLLQHIRGYAGPVNIGLFVNSNGKVLSVHHVSSKETESYLRKIEKAGFYDQFSNLKLKGDHKLDAISGATLTSEAIAETTTQLVALGLPDPLVNLTDASEVDPFSSKATLTWWWIVHIVVIGLVFLYGFQKRLKKSKKGILILSILSVIYIGLFLNNSFTYVSFLHPFVGTSVSSLVGIYALFTLLGAIWGKNTYCKYVCPFGNAQRLLIKITPKKVTSKFPISNLWINRIRMAIALTLLVGVLLGMRSWSNFELFPDLFGLEFTSPWFLASLLIVAASIRYPLIWCRLLCPTGSVLDIISDVSNKKLF